MSTSEQLERETEETRAQISATLDELRARMSVGQMVDQLVDYASDSSGGMFFHNLRRQVANNPLPVVLMGAGFAWLAMSNRRAATNGAGARAGSLAGRAGSSLRETTRAFGDRAKSTSNDWSESARASASDIQSAARDGMASTADTVAGAYAATAERAGDAASRLKGAARSATDSVMETASEAYESAAEQAGRAGGKIRQSVSTMRGNLAESGSGIKSFLNEQPLVLAGIGLALGAVIGAALPSTAVEDELMGGSSDALKQKAAGFAEEQMEKGGAVADRALDSAKQEAKEQGLASTSGDRGSGPARIDGRGELKELESDEASVLPSAGGAAVPEPERSEP